MVYKVQVTEVARLDLDDILQYLVEVLKNRTAASRLLSTFNEKISYLSTNPFMCELSRDPISQAKGYRRLLIKNYIAMYSVDQTAGIVNILRIFYGKRDWLELL